MGKVVHFEINAEDPERAIQFYKEVAGWKIESWGSDVDYWLVTTGDEKAPGIGGAIMRSKKRGMGTYNTIEVESLKDSLAAVEKAGGKKVGDINQVPGVGLFSYCEDTEGNTFGLLQPDKLG